MQQRPARLVHADAKRLAELFHSTYEMLAPLHDYETRPESRTEWAKVPRKNQLLMIDVCTQLLANNVVTLRGDLQATDKKWLSGFRC
jgi:hypothetical protein